MISATSGVICTFLDLGWRFLLDSFPIAIRTLFPRCEAHEITRSP
jgi:hypothetical protein